MGKLLFGPCEGGNNLGADRVQLARCKIDGQGGAASEDELNVNHVFLFLKQLFSNKRAVFADMKVMQQFMTHFIHRKINSCL